MASLSDIAPGFTAIAGNILGRRGAKKAARAQRRGLERARGHVENFAGQVEGDRDTTLGDIRTARDRINLGHNESLALIDRNRGLADDRFERTSALSRDNLDAFDTARDESLEALSPYSNLGKQAAETLASLYGGGDEADAAFEKFKSSTGYENRLGEGLKAVDAYVQGRGLRGSGAQLKALNKKAQDVASEEFGKFSSALHQQAGLGQQATAQANAAREAYSRLSASERRNMQGQVENLIADYQTANETERLQIAKRLDDLAGQDAAFRGALVAYSQQRAGITGALANIEQGKGSIDAAEILAKTRFNLASLHGPQGGQGGGGGDSADLANLLKIALASQGAG